MTGVIPEEPTEDNMQRVLNLLVYVDLIRFGLPTGGVQVMWHDDHERLVDGLRRFWSKSNDAAKEKKRRYSVLYGGKVSWDYDYS